MGAFVGSSGVGCHGCRVTHWTRDAAAGLSSLPACPCKGCVVAQQMTGGWVVRKGWAWDFI
jgi:hypothetical protein